MGKPATKLTAIPLPFVKDTREKRANGSRRNFWEVTPSGNYFEGCLTGREYALAFMAYEHEHRHQGDGPGIAGNVITGIVESGDQSGVVIGFMITISECSSFGWNEANIAHYRREYAKREEDFREKEATS